MSDQFHSLLVDIGNSRIKFAYEDDLTTVRVCDSIADLAPYLKQVSKIWLSCVGQASQVEQLEALTLPLGIELHIATTQKQAHGLTFAYHDMSTMGVDRWLAMIAAKEKSSKPVAVLSLGTANTCDILSDQEHLGGWIAPGFSLMKESLQSKTAQVFADSQIPTELALGDTTQDCVNLGSLAQQQGFVLMANNYLNSRFSDYEIFITGGASSLVEQLKLPKVTFFENLVLLGLNILSKK
ncbi:type III pantothenate kinase [Paraglaciecola sp. 2405UD69-4]|uniref:type III pantothenate kinase n=1 Tax=Paraglaciecola sp. 2405UD69-4 TaxID=3391836 RepID=UPI0039C9841C